MSAALLLAALMAALPADTLVVGTLAHPASIEPHQATDIVAAEIVANVCETLVRVRPGSLRPEGGVRRPRPGEAFGGSSDSSLKMIDSM